MSENKILRLTCPVCETRLRLAENIERFACLTCGTELLVQMEGGLARLVPSENSTSQMSQSQQKLIEINSALKTADDSFGVGCAVVTMGITLGACIALSLSLLLQSQILFWLTIIVALVLLAGVLFMFTTASSRSTDPLLRERDSLQAEVENESVTPANLPDEPDSPASNVQPTGV